MKFTKHIHVLHLLSQIPGPVLGKAAMTTDEAVACFDHLFHYIHIHWAQPLTAVGGGKIEYNARWTVEQRREMVDCRAMLMMGYDELVSKLATLPPYFREEIFPVAVARYLIRDLMIPIRTNQSATFAEFHARYATMILPH